MSTINNADNAQNADTVSGMNAEWPDIAVTMEGHTGVVEIQRPPHNFFDFSLIQQLAAAFTQFDNDPHCRAIVLAAAGKAFCAGANFGSSSEDESASNEFSEEGFNTVTGKLYAAAVKLFETRKPVIGAIQGPAVGGGLGLALVPDFRVASTKARFSANFVKLGLHQGFGISVTLPRVIGNQQAANMLLTGRRVSGAEALQLGLVDRLTDPDDLRDAALTMAAEITENAPLAVQSVRATLRAGLAQEVAAITQHELAEQQWLRATADAAEGIRAVAERRPGNFTGT